MLYGAPDSTRQSPRDYGFSIVESRLGKWLKNEADREDLTQDACLKLWRNEKFKKKCAQATHDTYYYEVVKALAIVTARRTFYSFLKQNQKYRLLLKEVETELCSDQDSPHAPAIIRELQTIAIDMLKKVHPKLPSIYILLVLEEEDKVEVARVLKLSRHQVDRLWTKAQAKLDRLRQEFEQTE